MTQYSGIFTLSQQFEAIGENIWPDFPRPDPYFYDVSLLLNGDGTNGAQNNTFLDSSTNNFTITRNGNTTQGSFSPYGNLWGNYFNGSSDYFSSSSNAIVGSTFTAECWVFPTSFSVKIPFFQAGNPGTNNNYVVGCIDTDGSLLLGNPQGSGFYRGSDPCFTLNQWNHVAITKTGSNYAGYVNGIQVGDDSTTGWASSTGTMPSSFNSNLFYIGYQSKTTTYFPGYISNYRVTSNLVYTTTTYTVPTTPLTAISGTTLLYCQSNRFIDNSSNAFALTINGTPSVQRFSPFNPTDPYSTSVIGGSMYDPGGTYLTTSSTSSIATNGDFTAEGWFYLSAYPNNSNIVIVSGSLSIIAVQASGYFSTYMSSSGWVSHGLFPLNQWNYCVVQRSGGTVSSYLNGTRLDTYSGSDGWTYNTLDSLVGQSAARQVGYYSNIRISNIARYSGTTMTVPTASTASDANTTFLLNMTNAGIPDLAMMNDLETVGNAQVSTSVKKYGTGSLKFNGSTDYLIEASRPPLSFGTGDFTVEFWFYATSPSANQRMVQSTNGGFGSTNWIIRLNSSAQIEVAVAYPNVLLNSSTTISANTWYYCALTRSGSSVKLWVNGVNEATGTSSANLSDSVVYVGGYYTSGNTEYFAGYIDDLRITKGYARYTTTFTPPTAALPTY